ncbi:Cyclic di-GMP phosphodiesterase Gmr [Marinomonas spartinae]|uniref:cyclic-guanylate-specific phosphodiesterase n=1 Tax=Marinomonas spartinae TaxID=1792290 RepID=A0A1A8TFN0_9GAMM|nr:Cyclic di-GMP phosphodiesterase Gmr [Marinomonas spartinae]
MFYSKRHLKSSYWVVSCLIVLCGLVVSCTNYFYELEQSKVSQFKAGQVFVQKIYTALEKKGIQVSAMVSFIQSLNGPMNPEQFDRMTASLRSEFHSPKTVYFFSKYVGQKNKQQYEQQQRKFMKDPYFAITPPGNRHEYLPLTYTSPNDFPLGYDLFSPYFTDREQNILARNNHSLLLSKPTYIGFNKGPKEQILAPNALLIHHSIYLPIDLRGDNFTDENGFYGVVGLHVKIKPFLGGLGAGSNGLAFRITDTTDKEAPGILVYDSESGNDSSLWQKDRFNRYSFSYGGRQWQIDTCPYRLNHAINWFRVFLPLLVSLLLAFLMGSYIRMFYFAYKKSLRSISYRIERDELTGLSSRYHVQKQFDHLLVECKESSSKLAALFLDLDHFKTINDAFGHETGDKLLLKVSQRLTSVLPDNALVGRLGGDEFLVLIKFKEEQDDFSVDNMLKEMILQLSQSYFIDNRNLNIGCSIGVAFYPEDGHDSETLVKKADMAMYQAKLAGRSSFRFYDKEMGAQFVRNVRIENRLRRALRHEFLELHFQPKVDLKTERCVGMEALMRWNDEELGVVSPAEFIPVAEQTGVILALGDWAFEQACRHIVEWQQEGLQVPPIAVNVSAVQLKRPEFLTNLLGLLDKYNVSPCSLELEVTESILIEDAKGCAELLRQLSRLGIKLSIDDFGTGYSSLSYLKDLPFDCVKIDQVFIRDIIEDQSHAALTRAIIRLSHDLNLQVIAEGITNQAQLDLLREYGCDIGQGYLFSKALGANSMASDPIIMALNQHQGDSDH